MVVWLLTVVGRVRVMLMSTSVGLDINMAGCGRAGHGLSCEGYVRCVSDDRVR